jgi:hypothetical protein
MVNMPSRRGDSIHAFAELEPARSGTSWKRKLTVQARPLSGSGYGDQDTGIHMHIRHGQPLRATCASSYRYLACNKPSGPCTHTHVSYVHALLCKSASSCIHGGHRSHILHAHADRHRSGHPHVHVPGRRGKQTNGFTREANERAVTRNEDQKKPATKMDIVCTGHPKPLFPFVSPPPPLSLILNSPQKAFSFQL